MNPNQQRSKDRLILSCVFLIALCVALTGCKRDGTQGPGFGGPIETSVIKVDTEKIVLTTELPGRTVSYRIAEIRPQVNGIIQKRLFEEGSDVKEKDVLYQIDPAPFQAALDNAKAVLLKAEAQIPAIQLRLSRYKDLINEKAISQQDYDDIQATMKQALADVEYSKAAVQTAKINLGYTRITAPISGRIGKSNITEGALVTAHQPMVLATVQQLDPMYVDIPQSTSLLLKLRQKLEEGKLLINNIEQDKVKIILEDGSIFPQEGILQFRDITVDETTGSVILRVVIPNPENRLLPGMFVRAIVREGINEKAILIPQQAVARDPKGNPYTFIVNNEEKVEQRGLIIDRAINDKWLVTSGLEEGDLIIIENLQKLRPGSPVKAAIRTQANVQQPGSLLEQGINNNQRGSK